MALLLRDREAAPEAATPPPNGVPPIPDFACDACGAGMRGGQDWCLECGTAARGRLGSRPGWRAAFTVVGLTLLLVCGAVLASYAALTSDAERTASAPTSGNGKPIQAQAPAQQAPAPSDQATPPIQPGATGPGTTPPVVKPVIPPASARPVVPAARPVIPPAAATPKPSLNGAKPVPGTGKTPTQQSATANVAPQILNLKSDAVRTYDPAKRAGAEFGPAANALDGKLGSVWDVTVPADGNPVGAGLLIDLGSPHALNALRIATDTPGFRAELYAAVDKATPADVLDKRWQHLTDAKSVSNGATISLKGKGEAPKYQLFLVYVTTPAQPTDPRVAINELQLTGSP